MDLPTLTITSYIRGSGSHATGRAIDLAISSPGTRGSKSRVREYLSVYIRLIELSSRIQRIRVWIANPDVCEHYHIDAGASGYALENVKFENGDCRYKGILKHFQDLAAVKLWAAQYYKSKFNEEFLPIDYDGALNLKNIKTHRIPDDQADGALSLLANSFDTESSDFHSLLDKGLIGWLIAAALVLLSLFLF